MDIKNDDKQDFTKTKVMPRIIVIQSVFWQPTELYISY